MKKILLATCALISVATIAQNRLDATSSTYYDQATGNINGADSAGFYYYSNGSFQDAGVIKPILEFGNDVPFYNFGPKLIKADSTRYYSGFPLNYTYTNKHIFSGDDLVDATNYSLNIPFSRTLSSYDANGNISLEINESYNGATWDLTDSVTYSYDANMNLIAKTAYDLVEATDIDSMWYNASNVKIAYNYYTLDGGGTMYLEGRNDVSYNGANFQNCILLQNDGAGSLGNLDTIFIVDYFYTGAVLDSLMAFPFVGPGFSPIPFAQLNYTYNAQGDLSQEASQFGTDLEEAEYDYNALAQVTEVRYYDNGIGTMELSEKNNFYYTDIANIVEESIELGLYPNPTTDILNIKTKGQVLTVKIVDMAGRTVMVQKGNLNQVHVASLTNGVYVMQVQTTEGIASINFVKK